MNLSQNFELREFTRSHTATRYGIENEPSDDQVDALKALCVNVLEPIRSHFGPVRILSGFRSPDLNQRIGGSPTSQHCNGEAADIEIIGVPTIDLFLWVKNHCDYDQLILEFVNTNSVFSGWVHVSYRSKAKLRYDTLEAKMEDGKTVYLPW